MGACCSTPEVRETDVLLKTSHESPPPRGDYAAFVSHCKTDAAMEARYVQEQLERRLGRHIFLDSDDLRDLTELQEHVRKSEVVILIQSSTVLHRPYCILELVTACESCLPIVGVKLEGSAYDFTQADAFLSHLDTALEEVNPGAGKLLESRGVDLIDAAYMLANTIPQIISVKLDRGASRAVLTATIADIVDNMRAAKRPALPDRAMWLATRGEPALVMSASAPGAPPGARRHVGQSPAALPPEVPTLPESFLGRPDLTNALKERVLNSNSSTSATAVTAAAKKQRDPSNLTAAAGMGGVGKTLTAAALARDDEVRSIFDKICWVSVGQEPDTLALQNVLHRQLVNRPLPEAANSDDLVALGELKEAAKDLSVLLVLDDLWLASHAKPLNFIIDSSATRSAVVVTTRMRNLLDGAAEVQCGTLSIEASLKLLLRAGGCEELVGQPPPAALEAVELCGRLPLALGIAGGIIEELADSWLTKLVPLLQDELGGEVESVEERVVTASLRAVPEPIRADVESLFTVFSIFPEDAIVPAATIDVVAPLMQTGVGGRAAKQTRQVRKCLQQLIRANVLRGSMEAGVSVHDVRESGSNEAGRELVRDCMIRRAEEARSGGLCGIQREAVPLLLAAVDAGGPAASYVTSSMHWHVRQAQRADVAIHTDAVLTSVLNHESGKLRKQGALGIGADKLRAEADACDAAGEHFAAAQLMWPAVAVRGTAGGAEAKRAWASLKQLEAAGRGSWESRLLESGVLNSLMMATEGGFDFGTAELTEVLERTKRLGDLARVVIDGEISADGATAALSKQMLQDMLVQSHRHLREALEYFTEAEAWAPDPASAVVMRSYQAIAAAVYMRQHVLPEFVPEACFGEGGKRLSETIKRYDFDTVHQVAKNSYNNMDMFSFGIESLSLLLWWGDVSSARAGFAKVLDLHKHILADVRQGKATAGGMYGYELMVTTHVLPTALLAVGDIDTLREFMANSIIGALVDDEAMRADFNKGFLNTNLVTSWKTVDGHCFGTLYSLMLVLHGLKALLEELTDAANTALRAWLPSPTELLRIAEYETGWRVHASGANHPALLCARLHGERLGNWAAAVEVAEGVLAIEAFHPVLRTEAQRLLGRAHAALGAQAAACEVAERTVAEAAKAKYSWFEMLALADLLKWCAAGEAEGVRSRLRGVVARLSASKEELAGILGEGAL